MIERLDAVWPTTGVYPVVTAPGFCRKAPGGVGNGQADHRLARAQGALLPRVHRHARSVRPGEARLARPRRAEPRGACAPCRSGTRRCRPRATSRGRSRRWHRSSPTRWCARRSRCRAIEEGRHAALLRKLVAHYEIPLPEPKQEPVGPDPEWNFIRIGYGECFDSFFAFGLYVLAARHRPLSRAAAEGRRADRAGGGAPHPLLRQLDRLAPRQSPALEASARLAPSARRRWRRRSGFASRARAARPGGRKTTSCSACAIRSTCLRRRASFSLCACASTRAGWRRTTRGCCGRLSSRPWRAPWRAPAARLLIPRGAPRADLKLRRLRRASQVGVPGEVQAKGGARRARSFHAASGNPFGLSPSKPAGRKTVEGGALSPPCCNRPQGKRTGDRLLQSTALRAAASLRTSEAATERRPPPLLRLAGERVSFPDDPPTARRRG